MADEINSGENAGRAVMMAIGAIAGLSLWYLVDVLPDQVDSERLLLGVSAFAAAFFFSLLAANGPLALGKSLRLALMVSVLPALLYFWASFRFDEVVQFMESMHPTLAFMVLVSIPVPFLIAAMGPARNWRNYPELFNQAWNIVVRYLAAWVFVGVFWGVVFLSDALFKIIGLNIIEIILDIEPVPFVLTGLVLGLALAVVHELSEYVSPYLILQLMRLLLPVILLVTIVFVAGVPFAGLSGLFGGLSSATILLAIAMGTITLVAAGVDQSDETGVSTRLMRFSTQGLAVILPVLAVLAAYAIWARVDQHGWTPRRLAAASFAVLVLGYAIAYALAVLRRTNWMASIRDANIFLAFMTIAMALFWLTPVLNPQRISTNSQLLRYSSGKTTFADLDLWTIYNEWGVSGAASIDKFADAVPGDADEIAIRLAALKTSTSVYAFRQMLKTPDPVERQEFLSLLPVLPMGETLPEGVFANVTEFGSWLKACKGETPAGNPACIAIVADFLPKNGGNEVLIVTNVSGGWTDVQVWAEIETGTWKNQGNPVFLDGANFSSFRRETIDTLVAGEYSIEPVEMRTINIDGTRFLIAP